MGAAARAKAERRAQKAAFEALNLTFWHGGAPGYSPGDEILSPARLGGGSVNVPMVPGYGQHPGREDRVYLTTDRQLARAYGWRGARRPEGTGWLYRVEPVGVPEVDADYASGAHPHLSFQCAVITVIAVEESPVVMTKIDATAAAARYMTWNDGRPMYDPQGYFIPSVETQASGLTRVDARQLWAPWTPYAEVVRDTGRAQGYLEQQYRAGRPRPR